MERVFIAYKPYETRGTTRDCRVAEMGHPRPIRSEPRGHPCPLRRESDRSITIIQPVTLCPFADSCSAAKQYRVAIGTCVWSPHRRDQRGPVRGRLPAALLRHVESHQHCVDCTRPTISGLLLSSRLQNQVRNRIGLRYEGNVTCFYLDRFRAHALGHEAFEIGVDIRSSVDTAYRPPCRVRGFAGEQGLMERPLNRVETFAFASGKSPAKSRRKASSLRRPSSPSNTMPAEAGGVGNCLAKAA